MSSDQRTTGAEAGTVPPEAKSDLRQQVIDKLAEAGVAVECPRCRHNVWGVDVIAVWLSSLPLPKRSALPPATLPVALVVCQHCGWVAMHSLVALGVEVR
jgi:hypothetical protein